MAEVYPASVADDARQDPAPPSGHRVSDVLTRNSAISVGRLLATTLVALVLPAYLTHRLPVQTYSAWVLLLQMSAYVGYLDFGVQTAVAKYVAEYDARGDAHGATQRASAGLAIMCVAAIAGVLLSLALAWKVPSLFGEIPAPLYPSVRISLILIGTSLSFGLLGSVPSAIFLGLQRYSIPTIVTLVNRFLYTLVILAAVFLHGSLVWMGAGVAVVNVLTAGIQLVAWRRLANHVRLSFQYLHGPILRQMLSYCSVLGIWTVGMLCVSGLDVTIVGHYDFGQTAFYSIATLPTNFILAITSAALGPLLPAASALSATRSPARMAAMLARLTRYCTLILLLCGLPLMVGGYWILSLWVGPSYAAHAIGFLRVLLLANIIRNSCLPYATVLAAIARQNVAIAGATAEAAVNLGCSIFLARRIGAMGVAYGTLIGSFVSIGMHFAVSMHYTQGAFPIARSRLFAHGIVRPFAVAIPSLLVAIYWGSSAAASGLSDGAWLGWGLSTLILGWMVALTSDDRTRARHLIAGSVQVLLR